MKNRPSITRGARLTRWVFVGLAACAFGSSPPVLASNVTNSYSANAGLRYVVQRSADLTQWNALATNEARSGSEIFLDQSATGNPGFYRVGLPNP